MMGVRGLETFLLNQVPNGVSSINILEEINRKKRLAADIIMIFFLNDKWALQPLNKTYSLLQ